MNRFVSDTLRNAGLVALMVATLGTTNLSAAARAPLITRVAAPASDTFGNQWIGASWTLDEGHVRDFEIHDKVNHVTIKVTAPFRLVMRDGTVFGAANMQRVSAPVRIGLKADPNAARLADRYPGQAIDAHFADAAHRFDVDWRLVQRKGSHYLREIVTVKALTRDEAIKRVELMDFVAPHARVLGAVNGEGVARGLPAVAGHDYFGFEQPLSETVQDSGWSDAVRFQMVRTLPLKKGHAVTYSAVAGETYANQLRRGFDEYVQRERAHPYRPFLHYNSFYDLGYTGPYTQAEALDRIHAFGQELVVKRHVKLSSFLFDGGWDDGTANWNFSKYFPDGFVPLCKAASQYGAAPGIWMSPWGGYGQSLKDRVANGKALGYGIVGGRLALSAPKYWHRFHSVVMTLLNKDCINQFKFDGTGNVNSVFPGSRFDSDFSAMIQLIKDIRQDKPDTFINVSTGTWPSPFWLRWTDAVWRGGYDHSFAGVGPEREQWITYRDATTYRNIVVKAPLFPINSLMLHGIIYARDAVGLNSDPDHDFANEVHSFFASGTDLQEMYITPSLLTQQNWDTLATAAKWSRANMNVLEDVHWIGGDPGRLEVYGWAAWTPAKAIVTFRNPSDQAQVAVLDLQKQLELPPGAVRDFSVVDVWHSGGTAVPATADADQVTTIELAPFEVLTLELTPAAKGR